MDRAFTLRQRSPLLTDFDPAVARRADVPCRRRTRRLPRASRRLDRVCIQQIWHSHMTLKNSHNAKSLTAIVGAEQHLVEMRRLFFRQVLRKIAERCAVEHRSNRKYSGGVECEKRLLVCLYRSIIFNIVSLAIDGDTWTTQRVANLTEKQGEDWLALWDRLKVACHGPRRRPPENRATRLARIGRAAEVCDLQLLSQSFRELELAYGLQVSRPPTLSRTPKTTAPEATREAPLVRPPVPWRDTDPPLVLGRDGAFFGYSELHPTSLVNCLVLGGTGSGKSRSVVIPLMTALLNYRLADGKTASVLIIDPKRELEERVRSVLAARGESDRLVVIGECAPVRLFAADCPLSPSDRLVKLTSFGPPDTPDGDHSYWKNLGMAVLLDFMQLETDFATHKPGQRLVASMARDLDLPIDCTRGFWPLLRDVLAFTRGSRKKLQESDAALRRLCEMAGVNTSAMHVLEVYLGDDDLLRQWCYACQSAEPLINALSNPDVAKFVDLDVLCDDARPCTDISRLVETGKVVLFCPEPREGHRIAGKAIKQKFFEAVFAREDLERPIGIVIDEAQKFITSDLETGEQSFLDRCRAYRTIAVLATQSIASLKHALGSNALAQSAVDIISANSPTKMIMRSTDADTVAWLKTQLPRSGDDSPHVVDIRRPSGLKPGEAYFMLADGSWGRRRARLEQLA